MAGNRSCLNTASDRKSVAVLRFDLISNTFRIANILVAKMQNILSSRSEDRKEIESQDLTLDNIETALANDTKVKLAGLDIDGKHDYLLYVLYASIS